MASSYAPSFHLFPQLPYEIRLAIIEEFIRSLKANHRPPSALLLGYGTADRRPSSLAEYATIDREWNSAVEKRTFCSLSVRVTQTDGHSSLDDLERICVGDRTNLVSEIDLQIQLNNPISHHVKAAADTSTSPSNEGGMTENDDGTDPMPTIKRAERVATAAFGRLFQILRAWSRDQEPLSFTYNIHIQVPRRSHWLTGTHLRIDSSSFPEVACVGSFRMSDDFNYGIQPESSFRLLTKLPNVKRAEVTFDNDLQSPDTIQCIRDQPTPSFQGSKLTSLDLECYARWLRRSDPSLQIRPSLQLTQSIFAMTSRLEELRIHHMVDLPYFLCEAWAANGNTPQDSPAWPNLRILRLAGCSNPGPTDDPAAADARLYGYITKALPHLPSITRLKIEICSQFYFSIPFCMEERCCWRRASVYMDVPPRDDLSAMRDGIVQVRGPELDPETKDAWQEIARQQWHCRLVVA